MYILYGLIVLIYLLTWIKLIDITFDNKNVMYHALAIFGFPVLTIAILLQVFCK